MSATASLNSVSPCIDPAAELSRLLSGAYPDSRGRFGPFGGRFVPETLIPALTRLEAAVHQYWQDPAYIAELSTLLSTFVGRPTALTHAANLSRLWSARIYLKREDLAHTGAHKINNAIGQALLARRMGLHRIIAETGAGQHGVATAAACAKLGLACTVYMGAIDVQRQSPNVERMKRLGTTVIPVESGDQTLRAAIDEALRDWVSHPDDTHYLLGSVVGPHPFPLLVRRLQSIIGTEARAQMLDPAIGPGRLPDSVIACVGGGSNAIGLFHAFLADRAVKLRGIEAGGRGDSLGDHAATIKHGRPGVLHGCLSLLLHDQHGQIQETHSISAGLDYPGVGPEHAFLNWIGRVQYDTASDEEALTALSECCRHEGILPALESSHALAAARRIARDNPNSTILVGLSGRGDKDMPILTALPAQGAARP